MAAIIHSGSQGVVTLGGVAVASIRSFSFEETQETIDATTMNVAGVAYRTNKPTFKSWSGSVDVYWTIDDVTGAESGADLTPGATEVEITFYPHGDGVTDQSYTGNCLITSRTISASVDGMVEATLSVIGTAAITKDI